MPLPTQAPTRRRPALHRAARNLSTAGGILLLTACSATSTHHAASSAVPSAPSAQTTTSPPATTPSATARTTSPTTAGTAHITIHNFAYTTTGTITAGKPIQVSNDDGTTHTVTITATKIDITVPGHGKTTLTAPSKPGRYTLTCDFHGNMNGQLTVT